MVLVCFSDALVATRDASTVISTKADQSGSAENFGANAAAAAGQSEKAARPAETLGELGDYQLLEAIGRGGQGWYFAPGKRVLIAQWHSR